MLKNARDLFRSHSIRRTVAGVFSLPPKTSIVVKATCKPAQEVIYRAACKMLDIEVSNFARRGSFAKLGTHHDVQLSNLELEELVSTARRTRRQVGLSLLRTNQPLKDTSKYKGFTKRDLLQQIICCPALVSYANSDRLTSERQKELNEGTEVSKARFSTL